MKKYICMVVMILQGCGAMDRRVNADEINVLGLSNFYRYSREVGAKAGVSGDQDYYLDAYRKEGLTAEQRAMIRGRVTYELMSIIDHEFWEYSKNLRHNKAYKDSFASIISIGLTAAGSLSSGVAAQNLSAADTILKGSSSVVDSTAFGDQAPELLINQMVANRARVAKEIYAGLAVSDENYPLQAAIKDLSRYYYEGSVTAALTSLVARSAVDAATAVNDAASQAGQTKRSMGAVPAIPAASTASAPAASAVGAR